MHQQQNHPDGKRPKVTPPLPTGPYATVVIDPPWPMTKIRRKARPNQQGFDYATLSVADIAALPVSRLLDKDGFAFLWTTQKYLPKALEIIEGWDLTHRFTMVWHKPGGIQIYNYPQFNAEFIVVGTKGNPKFLDTKKFNTAFHAPRAGHSVKPKEFYELLTRICPPPRVDLFSRRAIPGFDTWGDQAPGTGAPPTIAPVAQQRLLP